MISRPPRHLEGTAGEVRGQWMCEAVQEIDPSVWPAFQMDCLQIVQRYQLYLEQLRDPGNQHEQVGLFQQQPPQQPVFQQSVTNNKAFSSQPSSIMSNHDHLFSWPHFLLECTCLPYRLPPRVGLLSLC